MAKTNERVCVWEDPEWVCVWEDPEWNESGTTWIVSIDHDDAQGDSHSDTMSFHDKFEDAKAAGEALAAEKGLPLGFDPA